MSKNRVLSEGAFDRSVRSVVNENLADVGVCTTQLDATANTTLADIPGMSTDNMTLVAGSRYRFKIVLSTTAGASGGIKVAFNSSTPAAITSIEAVALGFAAAANVTQRVSSATLQASMLATTSAVLGVLIEGTFVAAANGAVLQLQAAQNASNGTVTSVFAGSYMEITRIV